MQFRHLFLIGIIGFLFSCTKELPQQIPQAKIYFIFGNVQVNGQTAKINQILTENDKLSTGPESSVEMILDPQTGVQLRENSEADVKFKDAGWQLDVKHGAVLNLVARGTRYNLKSPLAVIAVRGTIYYTHVYNDTSQYICNCNGTIEIDYGNEIKTVSSSHHTPYSLEGHGPGSTIQSDVMKEHDDVQIFEFMYRFDEAVRDK